MNRAAILKQGKLPMWVGGLQVQMVASSYYTAAYSTIMLAMTFWYTTGDAVAQKFTPWMNFWIFLGLSAFGLLLILFLDYKFIQPSRVAFTNDQSCKHNNPWMDELKIVRKDIDLIKKHLGIEG